jgi:hypothetical protein
LIFVFDASFSKSKMNITRTGDFNASGIIADYEIHRFLYRKCLKELIGNSVNTESKNVKDLSANKEETEISNSITSSNPPSTPPTQQHPSSTTLSSQSLTTPPTLHSLNDQMTFSLVSEMLEEYITHSRAICRWNNLLTNTKKKIRNTNFPSEISENIVKFVFFHKYKVMPTWDTDTGDLQCGGMLIEVKAFSSTGPTSFGPTEKWDIVYFLDATQFNDSVFKVYECKLKNTSHIWQQLKVNKGETYGEHAKQGRRPRRRFTDIRQQLGTNCKLIYEGTFNEKLCNVNEPYNNIYG